MKNEQEIKERIQWLVTAIDEEENDNKIMQAKLWYAIDMLKWVLNG